MEIKTKKITDKIYTIKLSGKFTIEDVCEFELSINKLIEEWPESIAVNMEDVEYIDSSGIGALIKATNLAKGNNINLVITNINNDILQILKFAYLDRFFKIIDHNEFLKESLK
ncbi:MAG: STAS domain-containing protein [Spirochaetes bacterium]|nr:STAS domain-containing protein [Spirochaetota bacterium]